MKIKKMTATFGVLDHAVLIPGEGLTVITAPNEAGKSTWAGFLKAMFYGIDTRERDKAGHLADKNRYQPWSGAPMEGELQLEWECQDITLRRFAAKGSPFSGFEAVYTASGDPVPGLTSANVGAAILGVGREVYLRSAFVGQGKAAVTPNGELEARIAALAPADGAVVELHLHQLVIGDAVHHADDHQRTSDLLYRSVFPDHASSPPSSAMAVISCSISAEICW